MVMASAESPFRELMLELYSTMVRINEADKAIQRGLSAGELRFQYYPAGGQEAIPAGIAPHLFKDDYAVITYRCIHDIVAKGTPLREITAEMYGRAAGTSKGKGGPMRLSDPHAGPMATTGIVGAGLPIANGLALAAQIQGTGRVTVVNFGDGATSTGAFHEALTLAAAGIDAEVLDLRSIVPLDRPAILESVGRTRRPDRGGCPGAGELAVATVLRIPKVAVSMQEGVLAIWLVAGGVLRQIGAAGTTYKVGEIIGEIAEAGTSP